MALSSKVLDKGYLNSLSELVSEQNTLVGYARLSEIGNDYLEFMPGRNEEDLPRLLFGTPVKINIYNTKLGFKVFSGMAAGSNGNRFKVNNLQVLADSERRQFLRVNVNVEAGVIQTFSQSGGPVKKELLGCRIEDISLSGLGFSSNTELEIGDRVSATFTLMDFVMALDCTIKRIVPKDAKRNHFGCFYTRVSAAQEESLHKLLIKLQQARRSRQL